MHPDIHSSTHRSQCKKHPSSAHANCNQLQAARWYAHALALLSHTLGLLKFLTLSFNTWAAQSYGVYRTCTRTKVRRDRGGRDLPLRCYRLGRLPDGSRHLCKTCMYKWALPGERTAPTTSIAWQGSLRVCVPATPFPVEVTGDRGGVTR